MKYHFCKKCNALYVKHRDLVCKRCGNSHSEVSEKRSPFWKPLSISVFKTYTTVDFDGEERTVDSIRTENQLCERFGVIRNEEFKHTYGEDYKYWDRNEKVKTDGISIGTEEVVDG